MTNVKPNTSKLHFLWRKYWWAAVILIGLAGGGAWYLSDQSTGGEQIYTVTRTAQISTGDLRITASGSGTLNAGQTVDLSFSTAGTVAELNVAPGDMVTTGDALARLDSAGTLEAALASAELELLQTRQALNELQTGGDAALAQAYQDLLTAKQTYEDALRMLERVDDSRCSKEVNTRYASALERTRQRLESLNPEDENAEVVTEAKNAYYTALANYSYCISYTSDEKTSVSAEFEIARIALQQAEEKYATLKDASGIDPTELALAEAAVTRAETALAEAQANLDGITLIAPISGRVISIAAGAGEMVDTSTYITIADVSQPVVPISVDESDMDKLAVGNPVQVVFDAMPDQVFTGTVTRVDPQLTSSGQYRVATGLVTLDAESANTLQNVPLGLNASVEIISQVIQGALLVPVDALKQMGGGRYGLLVSDTSGAVSMQPVEVGMQNDQYAQILSGVEAGDLIAIAVTAEEASSMSSAAGGMGGMMPMDGGMMPPP